MNYLTSTEDIDIDYRFWEIHLTGRRYFYISPGSKVFLNAGFVASLANEVKNNFINLNNPDFLSKTLPNSNSLNYSIGLGYLYKDFLLGEFIFQTPRDIFVNANGLDSSFTTFSFSIGCRFGYFSNKKYTNLLKF